MIGRLQILDGYILGKIKTPWEPLEDVPEMIDVADALMLEGVYAAKIECDDNIEIVYTSLSGGIDLYYTSEIKPLYGTNFWEIVKRVGKVTIDEDERKFFLDKGYLRPGKTLFKEIKRVKLGYGLYVSENECVEKKLTIKSWKIDYNKFINTLRNSISIYLNQFKSKRNVLLFSGGKDSALLAIMLKEEFGIQVDLFSAEYEIPEGFSMNVMDIKRSEYYKERLNLNKENVMVNCDEISFDEVSYLVRRMPLGAHPALIFEKLMESIEKKNSDVLVWTGQNADTVYGMGNTESNISTSIVRYFLTNSFLNSFDDTKNNILGKIIANTICATYYIVRKRHLYRPRTSQEYIYSAMNGVNFMLPSRINVNDSKKNKVDVDYIRCTVWENYQSAHLTGMDHLVIRNVGNTEIKRVFPYSSVCSMLMFRSVEYSFKDVLIPKRYISRYLREKIGKKKYKELYPLSKKLRCNDVVSDFEHKLMNNTKFGKSLKEYSQFTEGDFSLQALVSSAWMNEIERILNKESIDIQ